MASADFVFEFERRQSEAELEWIPLAVRMKLDLAGLRIGLDDWQAIELGTRRSLVHAPEGGPDGAFAGCLVGALAAAGRPEARRLVRDKPGASKQRPEPASLPGSLSEGWDLLDPFDRFVLSHLARKGRRGELEVAASELGLL